MPMNIWKHIRKQRFGLTQKKFGELIGADQATVCRWEKGQGEPSYSHLVKIREYAATQDMWWNDSSFFYEPPAVLPPLHG